MFMGRKRRTFLILELLLNPKAAEIKTLLVSIGIKLMKLEATNNTAWVNQERARTILI